MPLIQAVVLAAGEGTRLRPLTNDRPKPMIPIAGRPALGYVLGWLRAAGITSIGINLHHRPEAIRDAFGDGSDHGLALHYSYEETLLGTAGGVARFGEQLADQIVICYGDVLTDLDLRALGRDHQASGAVATLALYRVPDPWTRGVVDLDADGRVTAFREKPPRADCRGDELVNAGVYVLNRRAVDGITGVADFGHDVFPRLLRDGQPVRGWTSDAYVHDYGTLGQLAQAEADVLAGRVRVTPLV